MSEVALRVHPAEHAAADGLRVAVSVRSAQNGVALQYVVRGRIDHLRIPERGTPRFQDGLWRHTCFEFFVTEPPGYNEFNFSPSGAWAGYTFRGYRDRVGRIELAPPPIETLRNPHGFVLCALAPVSELPASIGLSAVLERRDGVRLHYALGHGAGRPDFHAPASFRAIRPSASGSYTLTEP